MSTAPPTALDRARTKAYRRLLPLLFLCYVIAYVDRNNLAIAIKTMRIDMPSFNDDVLGTGAGIFFLGYFLLEIPGTLLVEKWSARKWISRIMISWGIVAALTALVKTPYQFYGLRALLGLAEAGFFPGVIVYLTHWFPSRDRTRALSWFLIGTPVAQAASPILSYPLLKIGTDRVVNGQSIHYPEVLGLEGWQWVFIAWGIPAVVLGVIVLFFLTDRPHQARWLDPDEREALEAELERERALHHGSRHMKLADALKQPKVLILAAAYFFIVTGNYGVEYFLPTILEKWYSLNEDQLRWLLVIPAAGSLSRPALHRLELRPYQGAKSARGDSDLPRRHGLDLHPAASISIGPDDGPVHHRGGWPEGLPARILGLAEPLFDLDRGRRQHRVHQLDRQPGRLRRPEGDGLVLEADGLLYPGHLHPLRVDGDRGHDHPAPAPEPADPGVQPPWPTRRSKPTPSSSRRER